MLQCTNLIHLFISVINQLDAQNFCFTISLFHASTCFEHMCSSSGGQNCTYRCDDTRGCVMQFWPPDDEHMCSKHVEAWNKLIVKQKFFISNWLITEINMLICTVSKTSKSLYMFRTMLCSSSGCQNCIIWHLVSSHSVGGRPVRLQSVMIPDAV